MEFRHAIVKTPAPTLAAGLSSAQLGTPEYSLAVSQHRAYVDALRTCGLQVIELPPDPDYPDSTFVEDTALLAGDLAIITRPGAPSRRGETLAIESALRATPLSIERIIAPGTVDAGDIKKVGSDFFIGLSTRTNEHGAEQLIDFLRSRNLTGSTVPLANVLHLKSAVSYLENRTLLATSDFANYSKFSEFDLIQVPDDESYAANSLWLNGAVLVAAGFPKTKSAIEVHGYSTIELDMSEFRKLDGGLSCLSLRY